MNKEELLLSQLKPSGLQKQSFLSCILLQDTSENCPHLWCYRVICSRQCAKHNKELLQKNSIYFFTNVQVKVINLTVFFTVHLCYVKYHYFCEWYKSLKNQCRELSTTVELNVYLEYKKDTELCPKRAISGLWL